MKQRRDAGSMIFALLLSTPPVFHVVSAEAGVQDSTMIIVGLRRKVVRRRRLDMMGIVLMDGWIEMAVACIILYDSILATELKSASTNLS